jgi:hypothetical protein
MTSQRQRDEWLQDLQARQRNVVFPDTVQNEARFWRNLGKGPSSRLTTVGLAVLAIFVSWFLGAILIATYLAGKTWAVVLGMLLLWGPIFGAIAWATRRSLRKLQGPRRDSRASEHRQS